MKSRLTVVAFFLVAVSTFAQEPPRSADRGDRERPSAGRHFLLEPQHVLSDAEKAGLAAIGCRVLRPMANGRYLVRLEPGSTVDANDVRVRSLEPITAEKKLQPSAYRASAGGRTYASLNVIFNDEVSFEDARTAIEAAGGALEDVLATDFVPPQRLRARVPAAGVATLAADERVLTIYGSARYRAVSHNQNAAALSNVTTIQAPPYNLDGDGLVLSSFELGPEDSTHPEFGGRLQVEFTCRGTTDTSCNDLSSKSHGTHTAGTMIAAGIRPEAKGMAPKATMHGYRALNNSPDWLVTKETTLATLGVVADNNSWGVALGWCDPPIHCPDWTWYDFDEAIGGYEFTTAALDKAARVNGALMVHSAGNEAQIGGPPVAPFAHLHADENFEVIPGETFCYSVDGSGTDCPVPTCSAGPTHCETTRHPIHVPFGSVGLIASAKNVLTVGATDSLRFIASFSSRGPTRDGRVKPEITARGRNVLSTVPNGAYASISGTSMSSPVVTGTAALMVQQWKKTLNATPPPVAVKTVLIAGAQDLDIPGPDYTFGFGFLDGKASADLIVADGGTGKRIRVESIAQGGQFEVPMTITAPQSLRVVLGWADPEVLILGDEFADKTLVNDLDLKVIDPSGNTVLPYVLDKDVPAQAATRGVNSVDNTEEVEIANAQVGVYRVVVNGTRVVSPQQFVLIGNGEVGMAAVPCVDPNEPNDTQTGAFGYLPSGEPTPGKICGATDVDFFKVRTNSNDPIRVTVTAGDTPLRVTLSSSIVPGATVDVPANGTNTVQTALGGSGSPLPTADVFIKVEAIGTVGAEASYTITATYTFTPPPRRRAARG